MKSKHIQLKATSILLMSLFLLFVLFSCKKDSSPQPPPNTGGGGTPPPPPPPPTGLTVTAVSPDTASQGTTVSITGANFNPDPTKDTVVINNIPLKITAATSTSISAIIPQKLGSGQVIVKTGGSVVTGPQFNFQYTAVVTTISGDGGDGYVNAGTGTTAEFYLPSGLAFGHNQLTMYVADAGNNAIRGVSSGVNTGTGQNLPPSGITTGIAGINTNVRGYVEGAAGSAEFSTPTGIGVDASGNLYVADQGNNAIRKIDGGTLNVSTLAGGTTGFADGTGTAAKFAGPADVIVDSIGNIYVSDLGNQRIRKVSSTGVVTTIAGTNAPGFKDGTGTAALFSNPGGMGKDAQGNLYVADIANNAIRKVTPQGVVTTIAGGTKGSLDGNAKSAQFFYPGDVAVDAKGNIYVADTYNNSIRLITPAGVVSTVAGSTGSFGDFKDGVGTNARFNKPTSIIIDIYGDLYVSDNQNNRIRKIAFE